MKIIVGLGNPEERYTRTRHNAGFMVVDRLLARHGRGEPLKARFQAATSETSVRGERCLLMKPTTYMNRSGTSVGEAVRFYKIDVPADLLVIVDELYIPTGKLKLNPKGGTAGHNGLADIQRVLGTDEYPRLRVGVGLQPDGGKPSFMDQADFVLGQFGAEDVPLMEMAVNRAADAAEMFVERGMSSAMNVFNGNESGPKRAASEKKPKSGPGRPSGDGAQGPEQAS